MLKDLKGMISQISTSSACAKSEEINIKSLIHNQDFDK
jgi:hypothetical protein